MKSTVTRYVGRYSTPRWFVFYAVFAEPSVVCNISNEHSHIPPLITVTGFKYGHNARLRFIGVMGIHAINSDDPAAVQTVQYVSQQRGDINIQTVQ